MHYAYFRSPGKKLTLFTYSIIILLKVISKTVEEELGVEGDGASVRMDETRSFCDWSLFSTAKGFARLRGEGGCRVKEGKKYLAF